MLMATALNRLGFTSKECKLRLQSRTTLLLPFAFAVACVSILGCGSQNGTAAGVIRFADGKPVQSGSVEFRSLADGSRYGGRIASDGTFTLTDKDGIMRCPPGKYEIVVVQIVLTEDLALDAHTHGGTVPRRYADYYTSDLQITKSADDTAPMVIAIGD